MGEKEILQGGLHTKTSNDKYIKLERNKSNPSPPRTTGQGTRFTLLEHCVGWVKRIISVTFVGFADTGEPQHVEFAKNKRTQLNKAEAAHLTQPTKGL